MNSRQNVYNGQVFSNIIGTLVDNTNPIAIFAGNDKGTIKYFAKIKLYQFKVSESNDLIADFIPCYRKSDEIVGLYDLVEGKFYTNSGTGTFTKGNEIVNSPIIREGVGDLIVDTTDKNCGRYKISVKITNQTGDSITKDIILNKPLFEGDYIDFKTKRVVRNDGTEESVDLPEISTFEDYTKIEVLTTTIPLKIELEYVGYSISDTNLVNIPGYTTLKYIESTGTQYIDTKYVSLEDNKPSKIEVEFQFTDISKTTFVYGTALNSGNYYSSLFGVDADEKSWMFAHSGNSESYISFGTPDTNKHTIKYVFGEGLYLDGVLEKTTVEQASTASNSGMNIGLFARIRGNEPDGYSSLKLYSCKFYEADDKLVRNFIPVQRQVDGKIGLYDLVEDKFYTNSGTEEFLGNQ